MGLKVDMNFSYSYSYYPDERHREHAGHVVLPERRIGLLSLESGAGTCRVHREIDRRGRRQGEVQRTHTIFTLDNGAKGIYYNIL